jgi:hypothetical protein
MNMPEPARVRQQVDLDVHHLRCISDRALARLPARPPQADESGMELVRRHLSFANVVACLALFVALGGSAYAASQINGNEIVKHSIGGGKLKNETITSKQVKKGSLNSSVINLSSLGTVPSAQTAVTATTAQTATSASTASSATTASTANTASTATRATSSETADSATNAGHANSADSATTASHADTAGDAETVDGESAEELTVSCPPATELFGGMCWEESVRPTAFWIVAAKECGELGGRLPSVSELVAYILQEGTQVSEQTWSADIADVTVGGEQVVTSDETKREVIGGGSAKHGYRCLFYRTN